MWEKVAKFFTLEAVATYIVGLLTAAFWVYQWWKSRQGRHVICRVLGLPFSHLALSESARDWIEVTYVGDNQADKPQIDTLSEVLIDIKNDSDVDTLNGVELAFLVHDATVLRVWLEKLPKYLDRDTRLNYFPESDTSSSTIVHVWLPTLKSYKKYREESVIGILADGNLETIEMVPSGSAGQTRAEQTWTAKFLSFEEVRRRAAKREFLTWLSVVVVLGCVIMLIIVLSDGSSNVQFDAVLGIVIVSLVGAAFLVNIGRDLLKAATGQKSR